MGAFDGTYYIYHDLEDYCEVDVPVPHPWICLDEEEQSATE